MFKEEEDREYEITLKLRGAETILIVSTMRHISYKRSISIIVILNKFIFIENSYLEYSINGDISVQNDLYCCIVTMPPRPSIPSEDVQINDTDTELTGPENTQEPVGSSNPILIGQLRMIQVVR